MKRRYVVAGLGLFAAVALTSSALGGPSLNSLVKNEVAKQLSAAQVSKKGKRGPPGPQGPPGANGTNGANGTARAYAFVDHFFCSGGPPLTCSVDRAKGVSTIKETTSTSGVYCITAPGLDPQTSPPVATVDYGESSSPVTQLVVWNSQNNACSAGQYEFRTLTNAGAQASDVSFSFVIP
jgi:hypothetical protein